MCSEVVGCWVFPNGEVHETNAIESHIQALSQFEVKDTLLERAKSIEWTQYEKDNFYDSDLPYIAFKCGYIRIMSFNGQVGIQCLVDLRHIHTSQKNAIAGFVSSLNSHNVKCIVVEKFLSNDYMSFYSLNDFFEFLG